MNTPHEEKLSPTWREQLNPHLIGFCNSGHNADKVMNFISTEIIEKLIEDVAGFCFAKDSKGKTVEVDLGFIKNHLKNKWL
jgi:hypothetical protein